MSNLTLILLSAGSSSRFAQDVKKQWLRIGNKPLWQFVADNFKNKDFFSQIIIVAPKEDLEFMQLYGEYNFVAGGNTRQQSLKNALHKVQTQYTLVSDIARACIGDELLNEILSLQGCSDCVVPALPLTDTIVYQDETINRDDVKRVQTPQLSLTQTLIAALNTDIEFTDESSAIVANGGTREFVDGDEDAHKITYPQDLNKLPCLEAPSEDILSGSGFDVHSFEDGKEMVYILLDNSTPSQVQDTTIQEDNSKQTPLQDEITQFKGEVTKLNNEVKKLRSELNRLKVTVFKMAKEDAKILKI